MLKIIYGGKGSGKTKNIISAANNRAEKSDGVVIYITNRAAHSADVATKIRFVDIDQYGRFDECGFVSFVKGLLAGNYDISDVFIDGLLRFIETSVEESEQIFKFLDEVSNKFNVAFTLTVSTEELPDFLLKYN